MLTRVRIPDLWMIRRMAKCVMRSRAAELVIHALLLDRLKSDGPRPYLMVGGSLENKSVVSAYHSGSHPHFTILSGWDLANRFLCDVSPSVLST